MTTEHYDFERYLNVRTAYGPSFSPDGQRLSFLTDISGVAEVWSVSVDMHAHIPAWPDQLTFRNERVAGASYSPVADILLVSADVGGSERTQLYTLAADGSSLTPLTSQPEVIYQFGHWSPDGTRIVYSSNERDPHYFDVYERNLQSGKTRQLLSQDGTNYALRYSPDGKQVLTARYQSNISNSLQLIDTTTGEVRGLTPEINDGPAMHVFPAWSADKRGLYVLSNRGRQFVSLAWLDLATTELTYLRNASWDTEWLALTEDSSRLALVTNIDGYSQLEIFDVSAGWEARQALPEPTLPKGDLSEIHWSKDGKRLAFTLNTANDAPDIWVWDVEERLLWRATRSSLGGIPRETFVAPTLIHYPTFDGQEIPAFLYLPQGDQSKGPSRRSLRSRWTRGPIYPNIQSCHSVSCRPGLCCACTQCARQHRLRLRLPEP